LADNLNAATPQELAQAAKDYADIVAYETNWPSKVAAQAQAQAQAAQTAARIDAQTKQRQNWDQLKNPYTKRGK